MWAVGSLSRSPARSGTWSAAALLLRPRAPRLPALPWPRRTVAPRRPYASDTSGGAKNGAKPAGEAGAEAGKAAAESKKEPPKWTVDDFFDSKTGRPSERLQETLNRRLREAFEAGSGKSAGAKPGSAGGAGRDAPKGGQGGSGGSVGSGPGRGGGDRQKAPLQELFEPRWRAYFALTGAAMLWYWYLNLPKPQETNWRDFQVRSESEAPPRIICMRSNNWRQWSSAQLCARRF